MKVLFITYPMAFHTPGGGEIQLLAYKKYLEKNGVQVDLFDPWNPNFLDYDLVHFFSVIGGSVHLCNFIKNLGIPLVITSSLWITEETKQLYPVGEIRHQLSLADIIVGNSNIECDNMSKVLDLPREKFKTVYNGVEDIFFEKIDGEIFRKHFNINDNFVLNVGNIEPRKNQLNLAKAMKSIPNKKLVLIGHIRDKEYGKKVFEEIGEQLIYIEYLKNDDELLRSAFSACDIFCLPSTLETPGLAALEAFASGTDVIITREGATKEYFNTKVLYCNPESVEDITKQLNNKFDRKKTIDSKECFFWNDTIVSLINLYNNLVEKKVEN
jgi:glycosyltransferase involved in cell wall biosynthesis